MNFSEGEANAAASYGRAAWR